MGCTTTGLDPPSSSPTSPSDHDRHLPGLQTTPPLDSPSPSRFRLHHAGHWPYGPHSSSGSPSGVEQHSGALRLPHESLVLGRACRGSRVEKICGQNQCIGTLMERSNRFGNLTFPFFCLSLPAPSEGLAAQEKTTSSKPSGKQGLLISTASGTKHGAVNIHAFGGLCLTCYAQQSQEVIVTLVLDQNFLSKLCTGSVSSAAVLVLDIEKLTERETRIATLSRNRLSHHHHTLQSESLHASLSTGGCHGGASSTCLTSDSSPSCIM